MGRDRFAFKDSSYPHFITCTISGWLPILAYPTYRDIVLESLRYLITVRDLTLQAYVLMENHLHFITTSQNLSLSVQRFKSYSARRCLEALHRDSQKNLLRQLEFYRRRSDQSQQFWMEGSHPIAIRSRHMLNQKISYIHTNPVRRGYVDESEYWRYSSARDYAGIHGELPITMLGI